MRDTRNYLSKDCVVRFVLGVGIVAFFSIRVLCETKYVLTHEYAHSERINHHGALSGFDYNHLFSSYLFEVTVDDFGVQSVTNYAMWDDQVESFEHRVIHDLPWYSNYYHAEFQQWITRGPIGGAIEISIVEGLNQYWGYIYLPNGRDQSYYRKSDYQEWNEFGELLHDNHETYSTEYALYGGIIVPVMGQDPNDPSLYVSLNRDWTLRVEEDECGIDLPAEQNQYGESYSGNTYDNSTYTIAGRGCALTSLSMALNFSGIATDPGLLNTFMTPDYFSPAHGVRWGATVRALSGDELRFNFEEHDLEEIVCNRGYPAVVGVNIGQRREEEAGHWVVVIGKEGNRWKISDPGQREHSYLDEYGAYIVKGYVYPMRGAANQSISFQSLDNYSEINLNVIDNVDIMVASMDGKKTGYNYQLDELVEEIPKSAYFRDGLMDDLSGDWDPCGTSEVNIFQPNPGIYQILVTGLKPGLYDLQIQYYYQDGSKPPMLHLLGVADLDTISKFEVQISSEPGSFIFPTRIATFESTIMDITSSYRLELIKPLGIRNSLIKKIENASQAVEYRDLAAAKNILNAFKNEVRAQSSKDITETAAQILLEDADYLISRLQ